LSSLFPGGTSPSQLFFPPFSHPAGDSELPFLPCAAKSAVETAGKSVKELRVAEVTKLDMTLEKGKVTAYRARVTVSFKYVKGD